MLFQLPLHSQDKSSIYVAPSGLMAIGSSVDNFKYGGGFNLGADFKPTPSNLFFTRLLMSYDYLPINLVKDSLSVISLGAGAGVDFPLLPFMSLKLYGAGGYYMGIIDKDSMGSDFFVTGGLETEFTLGNTFRLGIGASYRNMLSTSVDSPSPFLFQGIGAQISAKVKLGAPSKPNFEFRQIKTQPIFPIFYSYYADNSFGEAVIANNSNTSVKKLKVSVFIPKYMDQPMVTSEISELRGGEKKAIPLYALFNDSILNVTEGSKVSMELILNYEFAGKQVADKQVETVEILYRNAMVWDDDRKAASFVTAKDPNVLRFAKNVTATVRNISNNAINKNFRTALGLFESLGEYGMEYVIDPNSSYRELSKNTMALDYLQFPAQSLTYKAGDCDDLSILYTALLESVGIQTAFITIPGHIYMAFSLGLSEKDSVKLFTNSDNLIFMNNAAWIPVEITLVQEGFVKAWRVGAKEWRDNFSKNKAKFYPMNKSWAVYAPVGSPSDETDINLPDMASLGAVYKAEMKRFVTSEIQQKVEYLKSKIKTASKPEKYRNSLGVLYARYGFLNKAIEELEAGSNNSYTPAMVNLANVYFIQGRYKDALGYYKMASRRSPGSLPVLVGLARTNYQLGKQAEVNKSFMEIEKKNPVIADRYAFLVSGGDSSARASDSSDKEIITWEE